MCLLVSTQQKISEATKLIMPHSQSASKNVKVDQPQNKYLQIWEFIMEEISGHPRKIPPKVRLFNFLSFFNAFTNILGTLPLIFLAMNLQLMIFNLSTGIIFFIIWFLSQWLKVPKKYLFFPFVITTLVFLFVSHLVDSGTLGGTHYYFFLASAIFIVVSDNLKDGWITVFLTIVCVVGLFYIDLYFPEWITFETDETMIYINRIMNYIVVLLFIFLIMHKLQHTFVQENQFSTAVLNNIMPKDVAAELRRNGFVEPVKHESTTILFLDMVGFSSLVKDKNTQEVLNILEYYFDNFDMIVKKYNVEKIKTIGDGYLAVGGVPYNNSTHSFDVMRAAIDIIKFIEDPDEQALRSQQGIDNINVRIGIHTGGLIAGVIGRNKYSYDVWGHNVNLASRIESTGVINNISVSETSYNILGDLFPFRLRSKIPIKNLGEANIYLFDKEKYIDIDKSTLDSVSLITEADVLISTSYSGKY